MYINIYKCAYISISLTFIYTYTLTYKLKRKKICMRIKINTIFNIEVCVRTCTKTNLVIVLLNQNK